MLQKSYVNAVLSIRTGKDRHESAFIGYCNHGLSLKEAALETVYGGNKKNWLRRTFDNVDWELLVHAIRYHTSENDYDQLLDVIVDNLIGVSYRKGSFMLAMIGLHEYMCIDSNVGNYADIGDWERWSSASDYMADCQEIYESVGNPLIPPFIIQWAIYDYERGEHARHMPFYTEVLPNL